MRRHPQVHLKVVIAALLLGALLSAIHLGLDLIARQPIEWVKLIFNFLLSLGGIWLLEVWSLRRKRDIGEALAAAEAVDVKLLRATSQLADEVAMNASKVNQLAQSRLHYTQQASSEVKSLTLDSEVMLALSRVSRDRVAGLERRFSQLERMLTQRSSEQLQSQSLTGELHRLLGMYQQRFAAGIEDVEQLAQFAERINQLSLMLAIETVRSGKQKNHLMTTVEQSRELALDIGNLVERQQQQMSEAVRMGRQLDERLQLLDQLGEGSQQWQIYDTAGIRRQLTELLENIEQLGGRASKQAQVTEQVMKRLNVLSRDAQGALEGARRNSSLGEQICTQLKQALDEQQR